MKINLKVIWQQNQLYLEKKELEFPIWWTLKIYVYKEYLEYLQELTVYWICIGILFLMASLCNVSREIQCWRNLSRIISWWGVRSCHTGEWKEDKLVRLWNKQRKGKSFSCEYNCTYLLSMITMERSSQFAKLQVNFKKSFLAKESKKETYKIV